MEQYLDASAGKAVRSTAPGGGGAQSIDRAATLLLFVGRSGHEGVRLADLVAATDLTQPTVHRMLTALVRAGLLDRDSVSRRYHLGPEIYVLGTLASARFGLHPVSLRSLVRLSQESGDTAFLSVARDVYSICMHREDGSYPVRVQALQPGDRHPLGIGAGSLALLAALSDAEVDQVLCANHEILGADYPAYSDALLRTMVRETRARGYALNPGLMVPGSWAIGMVIRDGHRQSIGALSIAAIESRMSQARQLDLARMLQREAAWIESRLDQLDRKNHRP